MIDFCNPIDPTSWRRDAQRLGAMTLPLFTTWYKTHDVLERVCVCIRIYVRLFLQRLVQLLDFSSAPGAVLQPRYHFKSTLLEHLNSRLRYLCAFYLSVYP
jgi:hypothetical protein